MSNQTKYLLRKEPLASGDAVDTAWAGMLNVIGLAMGSTCLISAAKVSFLWS